MGGSMLGVRRLWTPTAIFIYVIAGARAGCLERYYNNSGKCTDCPSHCIYCNSTEFCYKCDDGYSGTVCNRECVNCKPGTTCIKDTGFCRGGCRDGLGGQHCNIACDIKCGSCIRGDTTKCLTCRNNRSCEIFCPDDCYSQHCDGNHCTNGCLPGFGGETCENRCTEPCIADKPMVDVYKMAVPVLSILFITLLVVVLAMLLHKRRRSRKEDTHLVLYRPQHITRRLMASQADHSDVSSTFDDSYVDTYDHVVREAKGACADSCEESQAKVSIPTSESQYPEENKEKLTDVLDQELMYAYAMPVPKTQRHQEDNKDEISEALDQELMYTYAMPVPKSQKHQEKNKNEIGKAHDQDSMYAYSVPVPKSQKHQEENRDENGEGVTCTHYVFGHHIFCRDCLQCFRSRRKEPARLDHTDKLITCLAALGGS